MEKIYGVPAINNELRAIQKKHFDELYCNKFSDDELDYKDESYFYRNSSSTITVPIDDDTMNSSMYFIDGDNKEAVQERITADLVEYQSIYNLPDIDINPKEWDMLFDTIYNLYIDMDRTKYFYQDVAKLNRFAISYVLLNDISYIGINSYIDTVDYLTKELTEYGTAMLKADLEKKINGGRAKIISFSDYYNKKTKNI